MRRYYLGHPPRLRGWDYTAPVAYFVTFRVANRRPLLGSLDAAGVRLNVVGRTVASCWQELPDHFPGLRLDAMVVMPHHVHAVLWLPGQEASSPCGALIHQGPGASDVDSSGQESTGQPGRRLSTPTGSRGGESAGALMNQRPTGFSPLMAEPALLLGKVVRSWKAEASRHIRCAGLPGEVRQSRYHEHVVRSAAALDRMREYIRDNPRRASGA